VASAATTFLLAIFVIAAGREKRGQEIGGDFPASKLPAL